MTVVISEHPRKAYDPAWVREVQIRKNGVTTNRVRYEVIYRGEVAVNTTCREIADEIATGITLLVKEEQ